MAPVTIIQKVILLWHDRIPCDAFARADEA